MERPHRRHRILRAGVAALLAVPLAFASGAYAGDFDERTEIREEFSTATTAETLANPGGEVFVATRASSRLRGRSEVTAGLFASIAFKSTNTFEVLHTSDGKPDLGWTLPEAYLRRPFGRAELSVGRKILRWTNGYAFAPAGLLDPARDPADPQDRLGRLEGRDLAQLDFYAGRHTLTAVYAPGRILPGSSVEQDELFAVRYHVVLGSTEVALMGERRIDRLDTAAATLSTVLGSALELHAEAAVSRGSQLQLPRSSVAGGEHALYGADFYAPLRIDDRRVYVRWLVGLNYTLPGGINVIAEYFNAPDGLSSGEWGRFLDQVRFSRGLYEQGGFPPISNGRSLPELNLLLALSGLGGGSLGREYGFLRLAHPSPLPGVDASVLAFANLRDRSMAIVPEISVKVQRRLTAYGRATFPLGGRHSEFGLLPISRSVSLGLRLAF